MFPMISPAALFVLVSAPQEGNRASLSDTPDGRDLNALTAKPTNSIIIINQLRSASDRKPEEGNACNFSGSSLLISFLIVKRNR